MLSTDECSPSTEAALNQSEKSMQDQSLISATQQPPDRGNRITSGHFHPFDTLCIFTRNNNNFVLISDAFTILDATTSDLSATVSTNEEGSSSMFANYGDDSGDQSSLGKYFIRD